MFRWLRDDSERREWVRAKTALKVHEWYFVPCSTLWSGLGSIEGSKSPGYIQGCFAEIDWKDVKFSEELAAQEIYIWRVYHKTEDNWNQRGLTDHQRRAYQTAFLGAVGKWGCQNKVLVKSILCWRVMEGVKVTENTCKNNGSIIVL